VVLVLLAVVAVVGLVWTARPKAPGNRYEPYVRSTALW
jgi:hypothetical protein